METVSQKMTRTRRVLILPTHTKNEIDFVKTANNTYLNTMIANDTNLSGNWGDIVENMMPRGQQMPVATPPEIDYEIVMQSCSNKLHEIAIMASASKDPQMLEMCAYQKRYWTYWRAKAAQMFMETGDYTDITDSIYELQMTIDMATEMKNKEAIAEAMPQIISLRKLVARINKHAKDLEKIKAE